MARSLRNTYTNYIICDSIRQIAILAETDIVRQNLEQARTAIVSHHTRLGSPAGKRKNEKNKNYDV